MQMFRVTVNGKAYEVTVDELTPNREGQAQMQTLDVMAGKPALSVVKEDEPIVVNAGEIPVNAPLSGAIVSVKVKPGDQVKYAQVLLTLEALKMENEIVAPEAGVVKAVFVKEGNNVNLGEVLLTLG